MSNFDRTFLTVNANSDWRLEGIVFLFIIYGTNKT